MPRPLHGQAPPACSRCTRIDPKVTALRPLRRSRHCLSCRHDRRHAPSHSPPPYLRVRTHVALEHAHLHEEPRGHVLAGRRAQPRLFPIPAFALVSLLCWGTMPCRWPRTAASWPRRHHFARCATLVDTDSAHAYHSTRSGPCLASQTARSMALPLLLTAHGHSRVRKQIKNAQGAFPTPLSITDARTAKPVGQNVERLVRSGTLSLRSGWRPEQEPICHGPKSAKWPSSRPLGRLPLRPQQAKSSPPDP